MSHRVVKKKYECMGCESYTLNCKGHELVIDYCNSSDTVRVEIDGDVLFVVDDDTFSAILDAARE